MVKVFCCYAASFFEQQLDAFNGMSPNQGSRNALKRLLCYLVKIVHMCTCVTYCVILIQELGPRCNGDVSIEDHSSSSN